VPLDPVLARALPNIPAPDPPGDLAAARKQSSESAAALRQPRPAGVRARDLVVAVEGGEVALRVIAPEGIERPAPCLFYLHGGGWMLGDLENAETDCNLAPDELGAVFCFPDYRLAPEHPFPVPYDDCVAAYGFVLDHAEELGIDQQRVAVAGGSAGGNLAAAVVIAARDRGVPLPCFQLLEVPALDLTLSSPSLEECGSGYWITAANVAESVARYLQGADPRDPRASPIFAELSGLPPALILVAEYDPLRDDGERYAAALRAAGNDATCLRVLGQVHGSWGLPITPAFGVVRDLRLGALRRAFAPGDEPLPRPPGADGARAP
jgi:acetyl esterase